MTDGWTDLRLSVWVGNSPSEVALFVITWDANFPLVTGLNPESATPERLLAAD